ncbi:MAG: hypothetical protein ACRD23_09165, partial [Terriglobales bacterium]
ELRNERASHFYRDELGKENCTPSPGPIPKNKTWSFTQKSGHTLRERWRKVNTWPIKGPLLFVALLLGFFDHSLHWGGAAFAAGIAIVLPIIGFREFWSEWRFWAALGALALLQVPLVLAVRAFVEKPGFPLLYALTVLDCIFVVLGLSYVCCTDESATGRNIGKP